MTAAGTKRRPEWLVRKHGKQRSEPYLYLLAKAARCTAGHDGKHDRGVIITNVFDLDGNELAIATEDEARNVSNALYRSRPRGDGGQFLVSLPKPELVQHSDGTWEVRACVHDKAAGDAWINSSWPGSAAQLAGWLSPIWATKVLTAGKVRSGRSRKMV